MIGVRTPHPQVAIFEGGVALFEFAGVPGFIAGIEVDIGEGEAGAVGGVGQGTAIGVDDARMAHGAAGEEGLHHEVGGDQVDLVVDGAGVDDRLDMVAGVVDAHGGEEQQMGTLEREDAPHLGVVNVHADAHADAAEIALEDRVAEVAGQDIVLFAGGQVHLAIFADQIALAVQQDAGVVDAIAVPLALAIGDIEVVVVGALGELGQGGAAGNWFGQMGQVFGGTADHVGLFGQEEEVGAGIAGAVDHLQAAVDAAAGKAGRVVVQDAGGGQTGGSHWLEPPTDRVMGCDRSRVTRNVSSLTSSPGWDWPLRMTVGLRRRLGGTLISTVSCRLATEAGRSRNWRR